MNEAAEVLIDSYVWAYKVAELDERIARVEQQLSDAELMRIAMGGHTAETVTPTPAY